MDGWLDKRTREFAETDLVLCRKLPGICEWWTASRSLISSACVAGDLLERTAIRFWNAAPLLIGLTAAGMLCSRHEGVCVICDSYVRPHRVARICDECDYGSMKGTGAGKCVICGHDGSEPAYYCYECCIQEKDVSTALPLSDRWTRLDRLPTMPQELLVDHRAR